MQACHGPYLHRCRPFATAEPPRPTARPVRSNASNDMHGVRIEHHGEDCIMFCFGDQESQARPDIQPESISSNSGSNLNLQAQLASVSELARTRETVNATDTSSAEQWEEIDVPSIKTATREKALTFALVPLRERQHYANGSVPGVSQRLQDSLLSSSQHTGFRPPRHGFSSDVEYGSDEDIATLERHWSKEGHDEVSQFSGSHPPPLSEWRGSQRARAAAAVLEGMDEINEDFLSLLGKFSNLCSGGQLDAALVALSRFVLADRRDVLHRLLHRHFLKKAVEQASQAQIKLSLPVRQAIKFVQILPRYYATLATYNMVLSVCVKARDLAAARQVVDMLRSTGQKPDAIIFTSLITACAVVGDAEAAFLVRDEMLNEGHAMNLKAATSLINACSKQILQTKCSDRRKRLVLLEQADEVLHGFAATNAKLDGALWNAFLTAAGRASQLKRALQTLEGMQEKRIPRDAATFAALLDACVRNNDKKLALKTYQRAMDAGFIDNAVIYTTAMAACIPDKDKETALQIFQQSRRNGVKADDKLHAVLMSAVGGASLEEATSLRQKLSDKGIMHNQAGASSLIDASLRSDDLEHALNLLDESQKDGHKLSQHSVNSLLHRLGETGDIKREIDTVIKLVRGGFVPDKHTYTALLTGCAYADAGELAFTVWRLMEHHKIGIDEQVCFILLRNCYNQIRISHAPYEPGEESKVEAEDKMGIELVRALEGNTRLIQLSNQEKKLPWGARAISVYRKLTSSGWKPKAHVLERLVACFRLWALPDPVPSNPTFGKPLKLRAFLKADGRQATVPAHSVDGIYDDRAFSVLEEAVAEGLLPSLKPANGILIIDLTKVPPFTTEVYILEMLGHFLESQDNRRGAICKIIFQMTPPRTDAELMSETRAERKTQAQRIEHDTTFPAVELLLMKLGLRYYATAATGAISVSPERLIRWRQRVEKASSAWEISSMNSLQKAVRLRDSLQQQTMNIRNGIPINSARPPPTPRTIRPYDVTI